MSYRLADEVDATGWTAAVSLLVTVYVDDLPPEECVYINEPHQLK